MKTPFVTKEQLEQITAEYPTPFHLYDEKGIRQKARDLHKAFAWNKGFKEFFAVKATPTPAILKILHEEGCGVDCASYIELLLSEKCGFDGTEMMFSSNDTPAEEFQFANQL
ncbi:MAG: diaminopimelate decarboxylase, partial [Lactococcus lactis]|nr:diaminopimelate decarboxylase [Lactococcus lactis]